MKVFIINMPKDTARRANMENVIKSSPFKDDYEFVAGVNGRAMDADRLREVFDYDAFGRRRIGRPLQGEVGCTLSHHGLWQRIAAMDSPAMVLEDDLHFEGPWDEVLEFAGKWLATDEPRTLLLPRHFFYTRSKSIGNHKIARPIMGFGTECYIMNPAGARLLLSLGRPAYIADEWDYYHSRGLQLKAIFPHPIVLDEEFGSNIGSRANERLPWKAAARMATPELFSFGYLHTFMIIVRHKLGLLKKYLSPTEQ